MSISRRDAASTADFLELPGSSSHGSSGPGASDALQGETEPTIARIWEDLLGVSDIGADDDFFDLGGHSLIAFRLANRIEKQLGTKIKLPSLLEARTLRQIAVMIGGGGTGSALSSLLAIPPSGDLPPLFVPHAIGGEVLAFSVERSAPARPWMGDAGAIGDWRRRAWKPLRIDDTARRARPRTRPASVAGRANNRIVSSIHRRWRRGNHNRYVYRHVSRTQSARR